MKTLFSLAIISSFLSCSSIRYVSDHLDASATIQGTTYKVEGDCQAGISRIQEIRVTNAIHKYFQAQGYTRSESPDILVQFFIKEENNSYLATECDYYGRWAYGESCSVKVVNYVEGSIVIDVVQTDSKAFVWHGAIYGPKFDFIDNPNKKIGQYVDKLLDDYLFENKK